MDKCKSIVACETGDLPEAVLAAGGIIKEDLLHLAQKRTRSNGRRHRWPDLHEALYKKDTRDIWWPEALVFTPEDKRDWPGLAALGPRQVEMLELKEINQFPEPEARTLELKHNVSRGTKPGHEATTILPGGMQYLTHKCRFMVPEESLMLQGIHAPASLLAQFEPRLLQDLAGNAFETSCCMGTLVTGITMLAKILQEPQPAEAAEPLPSPDEGDGDHTDSSESASLFRRPRRPRLY